MKISVFGLGYVGVVTAACFCKDGHDVVGVDVADNKIDLVNSGKSPIIEKDVDALVKKAVDQGKLRATGDAGEAIDATDMALICVGTPSRPSGALDLSSVRKVIRQIGEALPARTRPITIVVRSTMVPGSMRQVVVPELEVSSGNKAGNGFDILFHPEFLREGSAVSDFFDPPKIVIGEHTAGTAAPLLALYGKSYDAPRIVCTVEEAETVKYCDNLFHALKITFANEVGEFCHSVGVNSRKVMQIFCRDRKLNISSKYLMPGFAFGGSCLPKDLRAFLAAAGERNLSLPTLENIVTSNQKQIERVLRIVLAHKFRKVGFYGISFKEGTDDMRESPYVELAERLLGKGYDLSVYDEKVQYSRLVGGNLSFVESYLPHLATFITDDINVLSGCPLLILNHHAETARIEEWLDAGKHLIDLTGRDDFRGRAGFEGIV